MSEVILSPEVEEFLNRLDPDIRDELLEKLQPDIVTRLAAIDDPLIAARLAAGTEAFNVLVETVKHSIDFAKTRLAAAAAESFLLTATDRESVIRAARILVPE